MNDEEKEVQKALGTYLEAAWNEVQQEWLRAKKLRQRIKECEEETKELWVLIDNAHFVQRQIFQLKELRLRQERDRLDTESHIIVQDAFIKFAEVAKDMYGPAVWVSFDAISFRYPPRTEVVLKDLVKFSA